MESRKQDILKAVVTEHTASGLPVGSQALASRYFLNLSSATIRNELSELSDMGYVVQPHTSAGRVPSDLGYRYFVDFLMPSDPVPTDVLTFINAEVGTAPLDAAGVAERLAATLATVTRNAAVVSAPHGPQARLKHVDLVSLEPGSALLVLVVEGNLIRQQVVVVDREAGQEELSRLAAGINAAHRGGDRDSVRAALEDLPPGLERAVLDSIRAALELFERGHETLVVHDGVRNLLTQPEFAEASRLQGVLEVLEETRQLAVLLQAMVQDSDLQIVIGSEHSTHQLRGTAVVLTTYGPSNQLKGVLGVVGPTRMNYGQIVGRLRAASVAASRRLGEA